MAPNPFSFLLRLFGYEPIAQPSVTKDNGSNHQTPQHATLIDPAQRPPNKRPIESYTSQRLSREIKRLRPLPALSPGRDDILGRTKEQAPLSAFLRSSPSRTNGERVSAHTTANQHGHPHRVHTGGAPNARLYHHSQETKSTHASFAPEVEMPDIDRDAGAEARMRPGDHDLPCGSHGLHQLSCTHWIWDQTRLGAVPLPCGSTCGTPNLDHKPFICPQCRAAALSLLETSLTELEAKRLKVVETKGDRLLWVAWAVESVTRRLGGTLGMGVSVGDIVLSLVPPSIRSGAEPHSRACSIAPAPSPVTFLDAAAMRKEVIRSKIAQRQASGLPSSPMGTVEKKRRLEMVGYGDLEDDLESGTAVGKRHKGNFDSGFEMVRFKRGARKLGVRDEGREDGKAKRARIGFSESEE